MSNRRYAILRRDNISDVALLTGRSEEKLLQILIEFENTGRYEVKIPLMDKQVGPALAPPKKKYCPVCDKPFYQTWRLDAHIKKAHKKYYKRYWED